MLYIILPGLLHIILRIKLTQNAFERSLEYGVSTGSPNKTAGGEHITFPVVFHLSGAAVHVCLFLNWAEIPCPGGTLETSPKSWTGAAVLLLIPDVFGFE